MAHCDIKPPNIVSLKQPDGTFLTRYIDFGLTVPDTTTINPADCGVYSSVYPYWPLEACLVDPYYPLVLQAKVSQREYRVEKWYKTMEYMYESLPQSSYWDVNKATKFDQSNFKDLINGINEKDTKTMFEKLDTFSLGITLGEVYARLIKHRMGMTATKQFIAEIKLNPASVDAELMKNVIVWHQQVEAEITNPLAKLIYEMIHFLPLRRPTPGNAKTMYQSILPSMKRHFTKRGIYNGLIAVNALGPNPVPPVDTPLSPTDLGKIQVNTNTNAPVRLNRRPVVRETKRFIITRKNKPSARI